MDKKLVFDISELLNQEMGAKMDIDFDAKVDFEDFNLEGNLSFFLTLMKIDEGIAAIFKDLEAIVCRKCDSCLEKFEEKIEIAEFEVVFYTQKPLDADDPNDFYLVDLKEKEIDLKEALRQQVLLAQPINSKCSKKCKGLCFNCGQNLNISPCNCEKNVDNSNDKELNKPFSNLKELLNQ